jgi:hypothetical protein
VRKHTSTTGGIGSDQTDHSACSGTHRVVVSLQGHVEAAVEANAHEGKPVELEVALTQLVAIRVEPPGAQLRLDDKAVLWFTGAPGSRVAVTAQLGAVAGLDVAVRF